MRRGWVKAALLTLLFNFIVFTLGMIPSATDGNMSRSSVAIWLLVIAVMNIFTGLFSLMVGIGKAAWRPYAFCMLAVAGILLFTGIWLLYKHGVALFH